MGSWTVLLIFIFILITILNLIIFLLHVVTIMPASLVPSQPSRLTLKKVWLRTTSNRLPTCHSPSPLVR
jgi:hypothetical protein